MTYEEAKMQIQAIPEKIWDQLSEPDREAMEMAFSALQAQEAKTQLSAEGTTSDLISRQDEIFALCSECQCRRIPCANYPCGSVKTLLMRLPSTQPTLQPTCNQLATDCISRQDAIDVLGVFTQADALGHTPKQIVEALPSVQPEIEERTEEFAQNVPKEDLISRKAAIDAIADCTVYGNADELEEAVMQGNDWNRWSGGVLEALEAVKELPSVQPEPHWIPVSERLPESKPEDLEYPTVIACCEDGEVMTACYYESTKEWGIGENYDRKINPVAWMPLPEPYRAERRTDD